MSAALPLRRPAPDARLWTDTLLGRRRSEVPPLVEYLVDDVVQRPIVTGLLGRRWASWGPDREAQAAYLDNFIEFWLRLGYDIVRFEVGLPFAERHLEAADPVKGSDKVREWSDQHRGAITSWAEFERFPWPKVGEFDFYPYEYLDAHLPPGMGLVVSHGGGVYEHLSHLMSFEGLCLALVDDPGLVDMLADLGCVPATIRGGAYAFAPEDVPTVAAPQHLAVRADMPDDVVYEVLKAVYERSDILFAAHAESRNQFSPYGVAAALTAAERSGEQFHPGALRFYREMGWVA